ncbi:HNH endonuclease [Streptomyces decoyicus]|uniref:HNH endonuclease n=1 Tax=Streptomyces decoyicus TaxID=249567 RepID=UPI0033A2C2FB
MAVSKRLRYEILRRDQHTCRYCGATAPNVPLRIDHVTPVALGGTDTPDNLVTACQDCNSGKSSASPDARHVAAVSDDALRWAAAMKQAANDLREKQTPKTAYREAFKSIWNSWTRESGWKTERVELLEGWKGSLDAFYEAGLPQEVWPDIIEKAMTNPTVRIDNTFRYACGIAWRMVHELQDRAKSILGGKDSTPPTGDSVVAAAVDVWMDEQFGEIDQQQLEQIRASATEARANEDAHRILHGAQRAAWLGQTDVAEALNAIDSDKALQDWTSSWLAQTGEYPDEERTRYIEKGINNLLATGAHVGRVSRAAIYAGSRRTALLHFGLTEEEQDTAGVSEFVAKVMETWSEAFQLSAARLPTESERAALLTSLQRICDDGDTWVVDVYLAAAAAGAYQDPDLSTCITRHLSVLEAAARPLTPAH